jgi:hypothetical protein
MLQFTQKLWRLETMKISKFLWSVLVVFATVALIAPQQVEAIVVDGRINGKFSSREAAPSPKAPELTATQLTATELTSSNSTAKISRTGHCP